MLTVNTGRTGTVINHGSRIPVPCFWLTVVLRLDMLHHAVGLMLGGALHVVEIPQKLHRVLDLGTGTGIWAIDMAE